MFNEKTGIIVVAGNSRSGTTLISRLLDGHPEVLSLAGETNFFTQLTERSKLSDVEQYFLYLCGRPFNYTAHKKQPFGTYIHRNENWQPTSFWEDVLNVSDGVKAEEAAVKRAVRTGDDKRIFYTLTETYRKYFWPQNNAPRYILEKTPLNEFHLEEILKLFPRAKIIHMIRDPFDVIESRVKGKDKEVIRARLMCYITMWKRSIRTAIEYKKRMPKSYCLVKFTDLVRYTRSTMAELARFLDIEMHDCLLQPTTHAGKDLWESHTHQGISVKKGAVEKKLLDKDSCRELGKEYTQVIGRLVGPECNLFGWRKYAQHINNNVPWTLFNIVLKNYPNRNLRDTARALTDYLLSLKSCSCKEINYL